MQDNNEEAKKECCGKPEACVTPPCPDKVEVKTPTWSGGLAVPAPTAPEVEVEKEEKPMIFVPEGLDIDLNVGSNDLSAKLEKLFAASREKAAEERELLVTGKTEVDPADFVEVELPNGMFVKVHKDSHKAKQEDMARLIEAAGGEMDCDVEDEDGNVKDGLVVAADGSIYEAPDDAPAETEYKAGQLRDLKAKFYPQDDSGAQAQARLNDRDAAEEAVRERFRKENEKYTKPTSNFGASDLYMAFANEAKQYEERRQAERDAEKKSDPVVQKLVDIHEQMHLLKKAQKEIEKREIEAIQSSMRIDWKRLSDPDFIKRVVEKAKDVRAEEMEDGTTLYVTPTDGGDLKRIFKAATTIAPDRAASARRERDNERRAKIEAERARVAAEAARIARLTNDIIPISPIENPSLVRRAIRTTRRTWKRLLTWWRL